MQKYSIEFVKDQIQKHYLKNPVLFPHKKHFSCCWIMPINKLMLLGIKKKKKKFCYTSSPVQSNTISKGFHQHRFYRVCL